MDKRTPLSPSNSIYLANFIDADAPWSLDKPWLLLYSAVILFILAELPKARVSKQVKHTQSVETGEANINE